MAQVSDMLLLLISSESAVWESLEGLEPSPHQEAACGRLNHDIQAPQSWVLGSCLHNLLLNSLHFPILEKERN